MNKPYRSLLAAVLALYWASCAPGQDEGNLSADTRGVALEGPISVRDMGDWSVISGCSAWCVFSYHFWVDLAVRNDAYSKHVGILWTRDGWQTVHTAHARYERSLGDGWEVWGIDVEAGDFGGPSGPPEVEFATFVTMNGTTSWDTYNNYHVRHGVTRDRPVTLVSSEVRYQGGTGAILVGLARVLDMAYDKEVTVRYSTDDWATWEDSEASWAGEDTWELRIEGLGVEDLPDEVEFALRYRADGEEHWDNNGGENYRHRLAPSLQPAEFNGYQSSPATGTIGGIVRYRASFETDIPIEGMRVRLDDGDWSDGSELVFTTLGLEDGEHHVGFEVSLEGGYRDRGTIDFVVENTVQPIESWAPFGEDTNDVEALTVDPLGRVVLVGPEGRVLRYGSFGDDSEPVVLGVFPGEHADFINQIAVDAEGRIYGLLLHWSESALFRLLPDGSLDGEFGEAGRIDLRGRYVDGETLCLGDLAVAHGGFYLSDICHRRVVGFDSEGVVTGIASFAHEWPPGGNRTRLHHDGDSLWVLHDGASDVLVQLRDDAEGLEVVREAEVEMHPCLGGLALNYIGGLTRDSDGVLWTLDGRGRVVALSDDGAILGAWFAGSEFSGYYFPDRDFLGGLRSPTDIVALGDGTVAALASQPGMVRFSLR